MQKKKNIYYNLFSPVNWQNLLDSEKTKHKKFCDECAVKNFEIQSIFPSTSIRFSNTRKENVARVVQPMKKQQRKSLECTSSIYNTLNSGFEKKFGIPFSEALTTIPETKLQLKPTHQEKRKEKRTLVRTVKVNLQHDFNYTEVDRCFGTRQSLKKWDNIRAISSFESVSDAEKRTTED